jgi:hypothetical protein
VNAPNQTESTALAVATRQQFDLSPQTFDQALTFANYLAESDLVPKDFRGKAGNCLIAVQWGAELGLKPMQALQNLAIINGRPSLWGDAVAALVRASPLCEYIMESDDGSTATCRVKRRGEPSEQVRSFSMDDAKAAGLIGKQGPWSQYPKRMRQMRARAFALRDVFPDVLRGLPVAEEVMDTPTEKNMGPADVVQTQKPASYPEDQFTKNLPAWHDVIRKGRKTADQIIAMAETKYPLTDAQKAEVRKAKADAPAQAAQQQPADQPQDVQPKTTFAIVSARVNGAKDHEELDAADELIGEVADAQHRAELIALSEARRGELPPF